MQIFLDPTYNWQTVTYKSLTLHFIGDSSPVFALADVVSDNPGCEPSSLGQCLYEQIGHFACIIKSPSYIIGAVDTIRSYPLFYSPDLANNFISNKARHIQQQANLNAVDDTGLLEFCMAGYVTGPNTVYEHLLQLQAGELLVWGQEEGVLQRERYYRYHPIEPNSIQNESDYIEQLDTIVDNIFHRAIEKADGAPIWIPLSGGLDSRLILCKLHELKYDNLFTFSYGPRGNYEAQAAQHVAETLNVSWCFVPPNNKKARKLFNSSLRVDFWNFADGLSSIPVMNEFETLLTLREQEGVSDDVMIINGQSGDFITGAHIPKLFMQMEPTIPLLLDAIEEKHFSLWKHLKKPENVVKLKKKVLRLLNLAETDSFSDRSLLASIYEQWECEERQAKYVVHGQRLYDFLGFTWALPLWDFEFMRFWETVPLEYRFSQKLYQNYLETWNYNNLFRGYGSESRRWPTRSGWWIRPIEKGLRMTLGANAQNHFAKYASYFGHYGNYYAMYGFNHFIRNIHQAVVPPQGRGVMALNVQNWVKENQIRSINL